MPKKGTRRCECGWDSYEVVTLRQSSVDLKCRNCGKPYTSRSKSALRRFGTEEWERDRQRRIAAQAEGE